MSGIAQKIIANPEAYSVDMLKQGVQDGSVPAYIGIPLIQEKVQALKKSQAMQAGMQAQTQPPIAQQVLADAQQATGLEALPTGLPTESFAPGGIIAFADGGETDDEEDDDEFSMSDDEKQLFDILRSRMASGDEYEEMAGIGALPAGAAKAAVRSTKHEVSSKVGNEPKQTKSEGITQLTKEGIAPESLINKIMQKESGGRRYDDKGNLLTSPKGAQGEMQVMPATSRDPGFGIRPARAGDHEDLARVGREYFNVMLDRYKDPKVAAIAYNWGPGNTDKWLMAGADMSKLPKETRDYSRNMSAGGVPGYAGGVYVDPMGNPVPGDEPDYSGFKPGEAIGNWMSGMGLASTEELLRRQEEKKKKEAEKKAATTKVDMVNPDEAAIAAEKAARYKPPMEAKPEEAAPTNPMGDYIGDYASYLKDRKEQMGKDKETNKYLALLQAGLGMMGGTSRYAGANIGQGASQGVAAYMAGRKQESADDRALQQGMLGLSRASLYEKMHLEDIKRKALADKNMQLYHDAQIKINQLNAQTNAAKANILGTAKQREFNIKAEKSWQDSPDYASLIKDLALQKKDWKNDTKLREQYERGRTKFIRGYLEENPGGPGVVDAEDA
jgi:hypothetical protein